MPFQGIYALLGYISFGLKSALSAAGLASLISNVDNEASSLEVTLRVCKHLPSASNLVSVLMQVRTVIEFFCQAGLC